MLALGPAQHYPTAMLLPLLLLHLFNNAAAWNSEVDPLSAALRIMPRAPGTTKIHSGECWGHCWALVFG